MRIDEVHCNHHLQASHVPFFAQVLKSETWTPLDFQKSSNPIWVVFSTKNSYFSDTRLQSNCPAVHKIQRVKNHVEIFGDKVSRGERGMVGWMVWISRLASGLIRWLVPISATANTHFSQLAMLEAQKRTLATYFWTPASTSNTEDGSYVARAAMI